MAKNVTSKSYTLVVEADGFYRTRPPSDTSAPTTPPAPTLTALSSSAFRASWPASTDSQSGVASYSLQRATDAGYTTNVVVSTTANLTLDVTGLAPGTYFARVLSTDAAGNASAYGPSSQVTLTTSSTHRWNPGHYMQVMLGQKGPSNQNTRFGYYDAIANETAIKGVCIPVVWSDLEGDTQGDYSQISGWLLDEYNYLRNLAVPKQLFIRLFTLYYGTSTLVSPGGTSYWPAYLGSNAYAVTSTGTITRWWDTSAGGTLDRFGSLMRALGSVFDGKAGFEGLYINRETAPGTVSSGQGYSASAYDSAMRTAAAAAKAAMPSTNVCVSSNFLGTQTNMNAFVAYLASIGVGVGGPDVVPSATFTNTYQTITGSSGGVDYRAGVGNSNVIPIMYSVETSEITGGSGALGSYTMAQIRDFANNTLKASHLFWHRQGNWSSTMLPYLQTGGNALTNTGVPTVYG